MSGVGTLTDEIVWCHPEERIGWTDSLEVLDREAAQLAERDFRFRGSTPYEGFDEYDYVRPAIRFDDWPYHVKLRLRQTSRDLLWADTLGEVQALAASLGPSYELSTFQRYHAYTKLVYASDKMTVRILHFSPRLDPSEKPRIEVVYQDATGVWHRYGIAVPVYAVPATNGALHAQDQDMAVARMRCIGAHPDAVAVRARLTIDF